MKAVIQRVSDARVSVDGRVVSRIGRGFLILLGIHGDDSDQDLQYLVGKVSGLRVFEDDEGKMNLALADVGGEVLLVSQFTLYADCRRGRRPGFSDAARPEIAEPIYLKAKELLEGKGIKVETGIFGAHMIVSLDNDGPVTILLDSSDR